MTRVADDVLGRFTRQMHDVNEGVMNGSLDPEKVYHAIKPLLAQPGPNKKQKGRKKVGPIDVSAYPPRVIELYGCWIRFWEAHGHPLKNGEQTLPKYVQGYDWPIVRPLSVTNQQCYNLHPGPKWSNWSDLNVLVVGKEYLKEVDQSPVVLIRPSEEPDQDGCLSYNQAVAGKIPFISIGQRIILDAFITWMHQNDEAKAVELGLPKHLDPIGWTRTSSLDPDGSVAGAYWNPTNGKFRVNWSSHDGVDSGNGVRRAVYVL